MEKRYVKGETTTPAKTSGKSADRARDVLYEEGHDNPEQY
jgi:hypothetical protein